MKKLLLALMIVLMAGVVNAQVLTLNSTETLAVPTAAKLDLRTVTIDVTNQSVSVVYTFLDASNKIIPIAGSSLYNRTWECRNRNPQLVANCVGVNNPYTGCTGVGTGSGLDPGSTCFTDTFSFVIRTQDVGTPIGKGLRALIWSKMRPDVLTGANNATLP